MQCLFTTIFALLPNEAVIQPAKTKVGIGRMRERSGNQEEKIPQKSRIDTSIGLCSKKNCVCASLQTRVSVKVCTNIYTEQIFGEKIKIRL